MPDEIYTAGYPVDERALRREYDWFAGVVWRVCDSCGELNIWYQPGMKAIKEGLGSSSSIDATLPGKITERIPVLCEMVASLNIWRCTKYGEPSFVLVSASADGAYRVVAQWGDSVLEPPKRIIVRCEAREGASRWTGKGIGWFSLAFIGGIFLVAVVFTQQSLPQNSSPKPDWFRRWSFFAGTSLSIGVVYSGLSAIWSLWRALGLQRRVRQLIPKPLLKPLFRKV